MKESIITLLHGIKAWGDARISRLREELQRQIRAARQMAVAAKQSADNADKRIGQLWDGVDGAYERLSELEARLNEELKLISHDTLQESVSIDRRDGKSECGNCNSAVGKCGSLHKNGRYGGIDSSGCRGGT